MSSLKAGALLSLFSGFTLEVVQRASKQRDTMPYDQYPSPLEIAYAARFSGPSQVSVTKAAAAIADTSGAADWRNAA
jgi:hypothetical protein